MSAPQRAMPDLLKALLIGEGVVAFFASFALIVLSLFFTTRPTSIDLIATIVFCAAPLLIAAGTIALARHLWRTVGLGPALTAAMLPVLLGVPFLFFTLGFGL